MIHIPENPSTQTIYKVQAQLEAMETPVSTFKKLLAAAKDLDFSSLSDTVTKDRYMESREKISNYYKNYIYMDVYAGSATYEAFINYIITLFSVINVLVEGRLDIMDMAKQAPSVVNEFLDSFGFEVRRIFDDSTNVDIAQNIYGYVRKKGTVQLLTMLLNNMGFSNYQVNEYFLNTIKDVYYLTPDKVYETGDSSFTQEPIKLEDVDDILRTLTEGQLNSLYNESPYYHMPTKTSYFSIDTMLDLGSLIKTGIALDIVRQYLEKQEAMGEDVRIFALDGYGEKLTFRELCLGYWMVFDYLYGKPSEAGKYPAITGFEGGQGLVGWNRTVTDPVLDIPKALAIYDTLMPAAASARDKFTRLAAVKKLFYRTDSENRFFTEPEEEYTVLEEENEQFYNFILSKIEELRVLLGNEANVAQVPSLEPYKFDTQPYADKYDEYDDSYRHAYNLLSYNSAIVQANKFYMTFLTAFEQVLYKYTKQIYPIKIYGTIAYLYNAYINMIVGYAKPYHSKLIDTFPTLKIGGPKDLNESVVVDDMLALSNINLIIYTDVIKWRYDNPYDWRPFIRDSFLEKIRELPLTFGINYTFEDEEITKHRIDLDYMYLDDYKRNHIYEDIGIKCDTKVSNKVLTKENGYPFVLYPSVVYYTDDIYEAITKNDDSSYTNNLDVDLVLVTDNYAHSAFKLSELSFVNQNLESSAKFGVLTLDTNTCSVYNSDMWKVQRVPKMNDIILGNEMPEADLSEYFEDFTDLVNIDLDYKPGYQNFLKFMVYVPAKSTFYLPKVNYVSRSKIC